MLVRENTMTEQAQKQPFWEELGLPAPGTSMTLEQYRELPETMIKIERIDGIIYYPDLDEETMSPTPRSNHQRVVGWLHAYLLTLIPDGEIILSPMDLHLGTVNVQPDVFWIGATSPCIDHETYFEGAPTLVIEIHSPSTAIHDKKRKFDLYEQHGIPEYWMVDPFQRLVEVYFLKDGKYARLGVFGVGDSFESAAIGKAVNVNRVFGG